MLKNIYIDLVARKLVFYDHFPESNEIIKQWVFQSNSVNKSCLEKLYYDVTNSRDWASYDIDITPNNIRLSIVLTFFVNSIEDKLSNDYVNILNAIIEQVNIFVTKHKIKNTVPIDNIEAIKEDSLVYTYHSVDSIELRHILEQLKDNNIKVHIEYEHTQHFDEGASGGLYEAILFISGAIASGVIYDLIKQVPSLIYTGFKKRQIDIFREESAHYLSCQSGDIEIINSTFALEKYPQILGISEL